MRLTQYEIDSIKKSFKEVFKDGKIYLFGSRVDYTKRGGDIDLYIDLPYKLNSNEEYDKKSKFRLKLYDLIEEQKIDIVISKDKERLIEQEALQYGVELMDSKIRLQKYLNECQKHKIRIEKAYSKVNNIFPISATKYEKLSDDEIAVIDQYLFRFAKLQDTLGDKVFRMIVQEYVKDINKLTFIDVLNYLEKINILENVNIWKKLRTIKNDISHQYDDEAEEMAEVLNNIFAYKDEIINILDNISTFYNQV